MLKSRRSTGSEASDDMSEANGEPWHLSKAVPISTIAFLIFQTIGIVIWATRLDSRVGVLEISKTEHESTDTRKQDEQDKRLLVLESTLPKLAVIEARQADVIKRLDANAVKLDQIISNTRGK